jgi:hypothetical protein
MAATNVQAFSGDVDISSNLAVSGSKFTYDNTGTTVFTGTAGAVANEIGYLDMSTSSSTNNIHVKIFMTLGTGAALSEAEYSFYIRPSGANYSLIYDYRNRNNTMTPVVYRTNANDLHAGGTPGVIRFGYSTASVQNTAWRVEVTQRLNDATFYPTNTGSAVDTTGLVQVTPAPFTRFDSNVAVGVSDLFVDTVNSRVGIGTTNPVAKLNIQGTSEGAPPTSGGEGTSNGIFRLRDNFNVALDIGTLGVSPWTTWLQVADTTSMGDEYPLSLNPNGGNVGIGVTNPQVILDVAGGSTNSNSLQLRSGDQGSQSDSSQIIFSYSNSPYNSSGYAHSIRTRHNSAGDAGNAIDFWLWNTTNTTDEDTLGNQRVLTLEGNGNVGIGISSPQATLDIGGSIMAISRPANNLNFGSSYDCRLRNSANEMLTYGRFSGSILSSTDGAEYGFLSFQARINGALGNNYEQEMLRIQHDGMTMHVDPKIPGTKRMFFANTTRQMINLYDEGYAIGVQAYSLYARFDQKLYFHSGGSHSDTQGDPGTGGAVRAYIDGSSGGGRITTFTGQHKSFPHESLSGKNIDELSGLIVCASGEHVSINDEIPQRGQQGISISEAVPVVRMSTKVGEKTVFGVISNVEDIESKNREDRNGNLTSVFEKIVGDTRIYVNSLGEGAIWVVNTNGSLTNGDYITTSNVAGYGQKQELDTLKNYTVAKITMDCDFMGTLVPKKRIKKKTVTETKEEIVTEEYEENMPETKYTYDIERNCYVKTTKDNIKIKTRPVQQEYELRDSDGNIVMEAISNTITVDEYEALVNKEGYVANITEGTEFIEDYIRTVNTPVKYTGNKVIVKTVTHEVEDLDEHGNLQWEDDPSGATETAHKIRYLDADGNITDEANHVHKAAFVGCTYHCG